MADLVTALGLILVIEGVLYALFPEAMRRMLLRLADIDGASLRTAGLVAAAVGLVVVWLVRG